MRPRMGRREFVKKCSFAGAGILAAPSLAQAVENAVAPPTFDIYAIRGDHYFDNTLKAFDALGGMKKFIQPGKTVGILINTPLHNPGAFVNPDIALAVVKMCLDAGAREIYALNDIDRRYWSRSKLAEKMRSEIDRIRYSGETSEIAIGNGVSLKKVEISKQLLSCDVYINIPIIKDHEGTRFTCSMKNTMGACSGSSCRRFHFGADAGVLDYIKGYYSNINVLAQSIADVMLVRRPDLCVVDATEFLATNGPSGPGELRRLKEIVVTTNCLAADTYAVRHLGLNPNDLPVITCARRHGYGPTRVEDIVVHTI